jgi:uncharacterized protein YcbK (DUF882 family)
MIYQTLAEAKLVWRWTFFKPEEAVCKGTGKLLIVPEFIDRLELIRQKANFSFVISSWYRDPEHNKSVSATQSLTGPHTTGRAVDIVCSGVRALLLVDLAREYGFTGIGVSQKGLVEKRFIHIDDLPNAEGQPRPHIWSY